MKVSRTGVIGAVAGCALLLAIVGVALVAWPHEAELEMDKPVPVEDFASSKTGMGETLVVVIGGFFASAGETEAWIADDGFGELQSFHAVAVNEFVIQGQYESSSVEGTYDLAYPEPGATTDMRGKTHMAVTAFRTKAGAEEYLLLASANGMDRLLVVRAMKVGTAEVGLGQEAHPDGSGSLDRPLEDQARHQ